HRLYPLRAGARIDDAGDSLRPRAQEHAGAGHHRRRPAVWLGYCICDHYRNRIPVAGDGTVVRAGGAERRYSNHGRLSADGVADLRHHQSRGRYSLYGCRSAPALNHQPPQLNARYSMSDAVVPQQAEPSAARPRVASANWLRRAFESDMFYSFRRSRLTMVAAAVTVLFF